ncbi:hypothetical protein Pla123a_43810 [Posidoniimonas polymericola]|uniref:Uncharacterized protein n=1 Tax=Posidoniimonas polymericola TaxID=2528002 RepID=A0A5C5XZP7_9BACT|nr:hypothetical protein Pla123a_43810 [Posidoniimonas polymericola]
MLATNSASHSGGITQYRIVRLFMRFFSVCRTVSWETFAAISNSTTFSASNRNDHFA